MIVKHTVKKTGFFFHTFFGCTTEPFACSEIYGDEMGQKTLWSAHSLRLSCSKLASADIIYFYFES